MMMKNARPLDVQADVSLDPLVRYAVCKSMARGYADTKKTEANRLAHARSFCQSVLGEYWDTVAARHQTAMKIKPTTLRLPALTLEAQRLAEGTGRLIAEFPVEDAGYLIGSIYTVMLPASLRATMGAYYTPPPLVSRLLDMAEAAGFDFTHGSAIDPACGGGAFLAPLALRMIAKAGESSPDWVIRRLGRRLRGIEIDPFAAWMTRVVLDVAVMPVAIKAQRRLADVVTVGDSLIAEDVPGFDLVIGNPPYGRVTLSDEMRQQYARSLFGHANLYGLFTDLALRFAKPTGVIAYLTPTSFLGGQYFKALRELLTSEATPVAFDFVSDRHGVFDDVLQETMLATYTKKAHVVAATVSVLVPQGLNAAKVEEIGGVKVDTTGGTWLLPRSRNDVEFFDLITRMPTRLADLGYTVSTGPLVWNRHKSQLREIAGTDTLPLIWAESIMPEGFLFSASRRNHVPFISVRDDQKHLKTEVSSVLVQRTTSKEQSKRLLAALLPQEFLNEHGGAVIENHLNMIQSNPLFEMGISPRTIEALLNSHAVDKAFRCISGSVAVSAYELNAIPMPCLTQMIAIEKLINEGADRTVVENVINAYYGVKNAH